MVFFDGLNHGLNQWFKPIGLSQANPVLGICIYLVRIVSFLLFREFLHPYIVFIWRITSPLFSLAQEYLPRVSWEQVLGTYFVWSDVFAGCFFLEFFLFLPTFYPELFCREVRTVQILFKLCFLQNL